MMSMERILGVGKGSALNVGFQKDGRLMHMLSPKLYLVAVVCETLMWVKARYPKLSIVSTQP